LADESEGIQDLLELACQGQHAALEQLFAQHRERLLRAIMVRLDRRVAGRLDASDILQETYLEAMRRLPGYVDRPNLPFSLWLYLLAREQVRACHARHIGAGKRAVAREVGALPEASSAQFVSGILGQEPTPSQNVAAAELAQRLSQGLEHLAGEDRELILWRHFEQLSNREAAQLLGITEAAASKRYVRALQRLQGFLLNLGISGPQ
jgi:RNA polymerase sigma-70 factor (ECF subfamily)